MFKALKNHPVVTFYVLALMFSWCLKIPVSLSHTDNILFRLLPSLFPALAALITAALLVGRQGVGDLLRQAGKARVSLVWYLVAFVGPLALNLLAVVLAMPFGSAFPSFVFPGFRLLEIPVVTLLALGEELGWRGFAFPRLQGRFNVLVASLIVGLLWWAWHLPEALGLSFQQFISLGSRDLIFDLAVSVLMAWIYNRTGRSVLLIAVFHMSVGGLLTQFLPALNVSYVTPVAVLFDVLLCIAAAIVVLANRSTYLTPQKPEVLETPAPLASSQPSASTV